MNNPSLNTTIEKILEKFPELVTFESGNKKMKIYRPAPPWDLKKGSIAFIHKKKYLEKLAEKEALLVKPYELSAKNIPSSYCVLNSSNLKLAMAKICSYFFSTIEERLDTKNHIKTHYKNQTPYIHQTAHIEKTAKIAKEAYIGAFTHIGKDVEIGESSFIGSHTVIGKGTKIGKNTRIHPHVYIDAFCEIGNECEIQSKTSIGSEGFGYATNEKGEHFRVPHYGKAILEDSVFIGSNVSIDRGTFENTIIGEGTKIDNHIHIAHNVQIGKHCIMAAGLLIAGSAKIGNRCHIGGRTTIKGHIEITDDVHLASYSVVTNSIHEKGVYGGIPILMPLRKAIQYIGVFPYLPEMRKNIKHLIQKLNSQSKKIEFLEKETQTNLKKTGPHLSSDSLKTKEDSRVEKGTQTNFKKTNPYPSSDSLKTKDSKIESKK